MAPGAKHQHTCTINVSVSALFHNIIQLTGSPGQGKGAGVLTTHSFSFNGGGEMAWANHTKSGSLEDVNLRNQINIGVVTWVSCAFFLASPYSLKPRFWRRKVQFCLLNFSLSYGSQVHCCLQEHFIYTVLLDFSMRAKIYVLKLLSVSSQNPQRERLGHRIRFCLFITSVSSLHFFPHTFDMFVWFWL